MRNTSTQARATQRDLFQPIRAAVQWEKLPKEIQQQSIRLLANLLREHHAMAKNVLESKEVYDE